MEDGEVKWFREEYPPAAAFNGIRLMLREGRGRLNLGYPTAALPYVQVKEAVVLSFSVANINIYLIVQGVELLSCVFLLLLLAWSLQSIICAEQKPQVYTICSIIPQTKLSIPHNGRQTYSVCIHILLSI